MKKITALCFITCALTTNNNIFGMLRSIIHRPNHTQQLFKRMISRNAVVSPPHHSTYYIYDKGSDTKELRAILRENRDLSRCIREQNKVIKQLIEINNTTLNGRMFVDDAVQLQQLENETYKLASRFNDLEKLVRP